MGNVMIAVVLAVVAIVASTGALDFIFVNYGPGYDNGKFKWLKKIKYKKLPSRIMLVTTLLVAAAMLLAVEYLGLSAIVATVVLIVVAVAVAVLSYRFVERD